MKNLMFLLFFSFNSSLAFAGGSVSIGENGMDLAWLLEAQLGNDYEILFKGFNSESPVIKVIDQVEIKFEDANSVVQVLGDRYSRCVELTMNQADKTVTVQAKELVHVKSEHVTESSYEVDGKEPFSMITEEVSRNRYFCVFDPSLLHYEWQKKAFLQ